MELAQLSASFLSSAFSSFSCQRLLEAVQAFVLRLVHKLAQVARAFGLVVENMVDQKFAVVDLVAGQMVVAAEVVPAFELWAAQVKMAG